MTARSNYEIGFVPIPEFHTPPPTALLIPTPTPTAVPITNNAIKILTQIFVLLSRFLIGLQPFLRRAAFFFSSSACLPGHTVQSLFVLVCAVDRALLFESVRHASTSDSYRLIFCLLSDLLASRLKRVVG